MGVTFLPRGAGGSPLFYQLHKTAPLLTIALCHYEASVVYTFANLTSGFLIGSGRADMQASWFLVAKPASGFSWTRNKRQDCILYEVFTHKLLFLLLLTCCYAQAKVNDTPTTGTLVMGQYQDFNGQCFHTMLWSIFSKFGCPPHFLAALVSLLYLVNHWINVATPAVSRLSHGVRYTTKHYAHNSTIPTKR